MFIPGSNYKKALALMNNGAYAEAIAVFEDLNGYKDSAAQIENCKYDAAVSLMNSGAYEDAIAAFEAMGGYKDSIAQIINCRVALLKMAEVGSTVSFGKYEQDNDLLNGAEDIEWIVLAKEKDRVLVISKYALDCQKFGTGGIGTGGTGIWKTSTLRTWLNYTFLNSAFSSAEQALILTTTVTADGDKTGYNSYILYQGYNDTQDKIFLLSVTEANRYFINNSERMCAPTAYAKAQGAYTSSSDKTAEGEACCLWWLRSPGDGSYDAALVGDDGSVSHAGYLVYISNIGIRPALWIELDP